MTQKTWLRAINALLKSKNMNSSEKFLQKIYVVGNSLYWYLNPARRAAYNNRKRIEVVSIEDAFKYKYGENSQPSISLIAKDFNQKGETFGPFLFCNSPLRWDDMSVLKFEQQPTKIQQQ